jgi:hypothetical protein
MRTILILAFFMQSLVSLAAEGGACEALSNENEKIFCTAQRSEDKVICKKIKDDEDKIHFCTASVSPNSYTCDKIRSDSKRLECLALVRNTQRKSVWNLTGAIYLSTPEPDSRDSGTT